MHNDASGPFNITGNNISGNGNLALNTRDIKNSTISWNLITDNGASGHKRVVDFIKSKFVEWNLGDNII